MTELPFTTGVISLLSGPKSNELLVACMYSLRHHYKGPITVMVTDDCRHVVEALDRDLGDITPVQTELMEKSELRGCPVPRPHWATKAIAYLQSPYDYTVYLDADTIVRGSLDRLFHEESSGFVQCAFCNDIRIMDDQRFAKSLLQQAQKLNKHGPVFRRMISILEAQNPYVINNGMLAFPRDHPLIVNMHSIAVGMRVYRIHDEIALNVLQCFYPIVRVPECYNAMGYYASKEGWNNAVVAHLHHRTWRNSQRGRRRWLHWWRKCKKENIAGVNDWGPSAHEDMRILLGQDT